MPTYRMKPGQEWTIEDLLASFKVFMDDQGMVMPEAHFDALPEATKAKLSKEED